MIKKVLSPHQGDFQAQVFAGMVVAHVDDARLVAVAARKGRLGGIEMQRPDLATLERLTQ